MTNIQSTQRSEITRQARLHGWTLVDDFCASQLFTRGKQVLSIDFGKVGQVTKTHITPNGGVIRSDKFKRTLAALQ